MNHKHREKQDLDFEDYLETVEVKNFFERARRDMFPKMQSSAISLMILGSEPDPKLCMELGAAILFDKPIIALAIKGRPVPELLKRIAAPVIEVEDLSSDEVQKQVREVLASVIGQKGAAG
jgi:hypothetical protein